MRPMKLLFALLAVGLMASTVYAQSNFSTSLHATRNGKATWYSKDNGGFESFSNVPISDLGCQGCHGSHNADGNAYTGDYAPSCLDCHATNSNFSIDSLKVSQCYTCHGRQALEANKLQLPDVHRDAGMKCWDCHNADEMHGNGTEYNSMLEAGAMTTKCEDCHYKGGTAPFPDHSKYDPHKGKLDCTTCHAKTVMTCYNCHFESIKESHIKRAYKPLTDFIILANREKDGKVYPMTFQSLTYNGKAFAAFGPFTPHTIMKEGRKCNDCHNNANVKEYENTGKIEFAKWNDSDSTLTWKHGVVPMPPDYETSFKMDFLTYNGSTSDPPVPSKNWSRIGKDTWDGHQMFYASPLTAQQMAALEKDVQGISDNFSTSIHATREGKATWYSKDNGGFESFTNIPISDLGCQGCHGANDADGNPIDAATYKPSCGDCHPSNSGFSPDSISVSQCYSCHGRQALEANKLKISDVHRDAGMKCWDCHKSNDVHGNGSTPKSMFDDGVMTANCSSDGCHANLPSSHASNDPHNGELACTACHAQTVLSCYNCHFESIEENHIKRAYKPLTGFVILANRADGKIGPMSFQSLTYKGHSFVAFAPFTSHTITKVNARTCTDCHENFGGHIEAIEDYNSTGKIHFATWNETDSTLTWKKGIVPMPVDYQRSFKMDFLTYNGNTSDPPVASKNWSKIGKDTWDGGQMNYATPLTKVQMSKLGFDTTLVGVEKIENLQPKEFALSQNYPNPFNPTTIISYALPKETEVHLIVYDVLGNVIRTLVNRRQKAGAYSVEFNGANLASGVYFYQIETPEFRATKKLVLMK